MAFTRAFAFFGMLYVHEIFAIGAAAFDGNFEITSLTVDCPSEVDPTSTVGSFLSFNFADQDTPDKPTVHCCLEWAAGQIPSSIPTQGTCSDSNVTVSVPDGQYGGFQNMTVLLAHRYKDNSVGQEDDDDDDNNLTKFSYMPLDYPTTPDYDCDLSTACCESCEGTTMIAVVTEAIA